MKHLLSTCLCVLLCLFVAAQTGEVFYVAKEVKVIPEIDTLFVGYDYTFKISGLELSDLTIKPFAQGTATISDTAIGVYVYNSANRFGKLTLKFTSKKNKSGKIIFEKTYRVITPFFGPKFVAPRNGVFRRVGGFDLYIPEPYAAEANYTTTADSAITVVSQLLTSLTPTSRSGGKIKMYVKMCIGCRGRDCYYNNQLQLNTDMKARMKKLPSGCSIIIPEIYYYCNRPKSVAPTQGRWPIPGRMRLGPYEIAIK